MKKGFNSHKPLCLNIPTKVIAGIGAGIFALSGCGFGETVPNPTNGRIAVEMNCSSGERPTLGYGSATDTTKLSCMPDKTNPRTVYFPGKFKLRFINNDDHAGFLDEGKHRPDAVVFFGEHTGRDLRLDKRGSLIPIPQHLTESKPIGSGELHVNGPPLFVFGDDANIIGVDLENKSLQGKANVGSKINGDKTQREAA